MTVPSNSASRGLTPGLHGCSVGGKSTDVVSRQPTEGDPAHASTSSTSVEKLISHTEKKRVRVLVLVDHGLFRASLGLLLASDQDLEVVGESDMYRNAPALEVLGRSEADVALLEFASDAEPGPKIISAAKSAGYRGRFLILTRSTMSAIRRWHSGLVHRAFSRKPGRRRGSCRLSSLGRWPYLD